MRDLMLRRLRDDRGATAVIVTISLVAIFAMLMLTIDVGGLLYRHRKLVNGADAAALAAAQSCAIDSDTDDPEVIADQYAMENVSDLVPADGGIVADPALTFGCDTDGVGRVTVRYEMPQHLYFAPVLGFDNSTPASAQATASWSPGGGNAVPIVVDSGTIQGTCGIPNDVKIGDSCNLWYDNGNLELGNANWGFMNLDQWNVAADASCDSAGGANNRADYIQNDFQDDLPMNGDPPGSAPTYVCTSTGHATSNWDDLRSRIGDVLMFPVNDCGGQVDKNGIVTPCPSTPDKYDIIGFTSLYLVDVLRGNDPAAFGSLAASGTCNQDFQPFDADGDATTLQTFNLNSFGTFSSQCFGSAPDNLSGLIITPKKNGLPAYRLCAPGQTVGCEYQYDPATRNVTWVGPGTTRVGSKESDDDLHISFSWSFNGTPGLCEPPDRSSDPNALCLITEWRGFALTAKTGGQDFGVRSIHLCDPDITASCPEP